MSSKMQVLQSMIDVQKDLDWMEKVSNIVDSPFFDAILYRTYRYFMAEFEGDERVGVIEQSIASIDLRNKRVVLTPPTIPYYDYDEIAHKINGLAWGTTVSWTVVVEKEFEGVTFVLQHEQYINLPEEEMELLQALGKTSISEPTPELNILCG